MANDALCQSRVRRGSLGGAVPVLDQRGTRQRAEPVGLQIGGGVNPGNARQRGGGPGVQARDLCRGMRAAQHDAEQHPRQHDIIGVAAGAFQQPGILHTADRLREAELRGCHDLVSEGCFCSVTAPCTLKAGKAKGASPCLAVSWC